MARTKLIVAGVLIAGALTTGLGSRLLSTADAQAPRKTAKAPTAASPDKWEYKFVPMVKAPSAEELSKLLAQHGRDRWEYCGSQALATGRSAEVPHLTFKRPRSADQDAAALDELEAMRLYLKAAELKSETKEQDLYRKALLDAQREYEALLSKTNDARKQAAATDKIRNLQSEMDRATAEAQAAVRTKQLEAERREVSDKNRAARDVELKRAADEQAAIAREAQAKIKALEAELQQSRQRGELLARRLADLEVELKKPAAPKAADTKAEVKIYRLKNVSAEEMGKVLQAVFVKADVRIVPEPTSNSVLLSGSLDAMAEVAKVIDELDRAAKD